MKLGISVILINGLKLKKKKLNDKNKTALLFQVFKKKMYTLLFNTQILNYSSSVVEDRENKIYKKKNNNEITEGHFVKKPKKN